MKKFRLVLAITCAIATAQPPARTAGEIEAEMSRDLRGDGSHPSTQQPGPLVPSVIIDHPVLERPTGERVSVYQLEHKVSKDVSKSFMRAGQLLAAGKHSLAAEELEKTVKKDPQFASGYDMLGVEYGELGRFREAETSLRRSIELDPNVWSAHYNLAIVMVQLFDLTAAERSSRRALDLAPAEARVHLLLGYVLYVREESRQEGVEHLRVAARTMDEAKEFLKTIQVQ